MSDEMDAFLKGKAEAEPAPEAEPPPEQETQPEPAPDSSEGDEQQAKAPEDAPRDGRTVPLAALEGERKARQDWKDKAARAETERDELRKQLEEIKRQAEQARQAPQQQMMHQVPMDQLPPMTPEQIAIHQAANFSELVLRQKIGDEEVDQLIKEAEVEIHRDPTLAQQLARQKYPYQWLHSHMQKLKAQREIGDDPNAYKSKLEAEIRERVMAEMAQQQPAAPRVSPAAGMAPSLANVRSAAPRGAPAFSGPTPMGDLLPNG